MEIKNCNLIFVKLRYIVFIFLILALNDYSFAKIISSKITLQEVYKSSSLVITGNVKNITSFKDGNIAVINKINIIKGFLKQKEVKVLFFNKVVKPKTSVEIEKAILNFSKGENVMLFLTSYKDYFRVTNFHYGKLIVINSDINIPYLYQRNNNLSTIEPLEKIINILIKKR